MNRWKAVEKRDTLTNRECQHLSEELQRVCSPRPSGTRMDPAVSSWRWVHNWVRGMVEHQLRKRESEVGREEIGALVGGYYHGKH